MENLAVTGGARPDRGFWAGKRVVLTGHTGFKGAWLSIWLGRLGAEVTGIALPPETQPSLFALARPDLKESHFQDIRDAARLAELVRSASPEIVMHLGAQALVRPSYQDPLGTFATNVLGTANLLEAVRSVPSARVIVAITTDKVYRNLEHAFPYRETDHLGGHDPYSASKAASEIVIASYRDSFLREKGVAVASARAGNVIGGGDWSADRLLPDAVRAWQSGNTLSVRRPEAKRPWQHVLEPLSAYLVLAERLWSDPSIGDAFNFGPISHEAAPVRQVIEIARTSFGRGEVQYGDGTEGPHEAGWLALETAKARHMLDIEPRWSLAEAVDRTMKWYRAQNDGADARALCEAEIAEYEARR
ncbi:CDP-glucose 4,6-dehydratase [Neorhizobium galegae]|uniref:CDP-glucose 4,6-dehydratase n=1 Tax=Neorhizobium galegae TaxID=399 RepID=UPI000621FED1|nr:CDP-glucose 4,6-dehydratase [Neorhizobium galegae]KAB1127044.1 CDP-glucose 4,6-dehydratase [Neorhizobium galegae]MCQ1808741.1 CDP-glucose 4,6-dehydratase [Neorhizobium galegae]CDZ57041.1 CDP-glucose 4,6-dehydratase [Neorhizobium galegae bv. orientalis]CDZ68967.1 CDP-glucose 4,6-dehydratase [Neorhizobium galegae bv. orientalis]